MIKLTNKQGSCLASLLVFIAIIGIVIFTGYKWLENYLHEDNLKHIENTKKYARMDEDGICILNGEMLSEALIYRKDEIIAPIANKKEIQTAIAKLHDQEFDKYLASSSDKFPFEVSEGMTTIGEEICTHRFPSQNIRGIVYEFNKGTTYILPYPEEDHEDVDCHGRACYSTIINDYQNLRYHYYRYFNDYWIVKFRTGK